MALAAVSGIEGTQERLAAGVDAVRSLHNDERTTLKALVALFQLVSPCSGQALMVLFGL